MLNNYIRGGQIFLHKLRMLLQVWYHNFFLALILSILLSCSLASNKILEIDHIASISYIKAIIIDKFDKSLGKETGSYISANSKYGIYSKEIPAAKILGQSYFQKKFEELKHISSDLVREILILFFSFSVSISFIWHIFGKISKNINIINGKEVLEAATAKKILKRMKQESELKVGNMSLVKNSETSHILFTGTTGTGKTTSMNEMAEQIRLQERPAIIIDYNGLMSREFYREGDIIIGKDEYCWDFFEDIKDSDNLAIIADAIFEAKGGNSDEMWNNASKALFKDAASIISKKNNPLISDLWNLLARENLNILHEKLVGYTSHSMVDPANEKTALSIRTNCLAYLGWMEKAGDSLKKFSIRNWINNPNKRNWIFLKASPKERSFLRSLYSIIIDLFISQIMELGEDEDRRIWLIIDELASLNKIPNLAIALAEFRKYGGCIMASLQSPNQLYDIYGHSKANYMLDQFNTKFIFRTEEYNFANYLCKGIGTMNYIEKSENYSYGSHEIRDGVNISSNEKQKPILSPSDLASLNNMEAYAILPLREAKIVKVKIVHALAKK